MPEMIAGVEFSDEALHKLRIVVPDEDRWRGFAVSIAAMLTHHEDLRWVRLRTHPPHWPRVKLEKWPTRDVWVTEIWDCIIAFVDGNPVRVLDVWER